MKATTPQSFDAAFMALQAHKEEGLAFFFESYYSQLVLYAAKIVGDDAVGEEIASEVFVQLWRKCKKLKASNAVKPTLYVMVRNAAIDHLRLQKMLNKRQKAYLLCHGKYYWKTSLFRDDELVETETYRLLYARLQSLSPRTQEIFRLFYYQDKSIKEIASILHISVNTVKTLKLRAVQHLRTVKLASLFLGLLTCFSKV